MADLVSYALTTVDDVKENLGVTVNTYNNLIIRKINQATEIIENYTGRRFKLTAYTNDEYDATNTDQLILRQRPVVVDDDHTFSMGSRDTSLNDDDWSTTDANLQFVDSKAGVVDLNFGAIGHWNRYRVSYSAGYATIPFDLSEAAAELASYLVKNTSSYSISVTGEDTNVKKKTEGQRSIEYFENKSSTSTGGGNGYDAVFAELGIAGTINSYSNYPILADK